MESVSNAVSGLPNPLSIFQKKDRRPIIVKKQKQQKNVKPLLEIYDETNFKYTLTVICSKKGSGKSTLLVKLLLDPRAYKGKYDRIIIISSTFRAQFDTLWNKLNQQGIEVHD